MSIAQRDEGPCQRKQAHQRDRVGGRSEQQVCRQAGHDAAGQDHRAEDDIGGCGRGDSHSQATTDSFQKSLLQRAVRAQQRAERSVLQPGTALVDPPGEQGRTEHREQDRER